MAKKPKSSDLLSPLKIPEDKIGDWAIVHKMAPPNTPFTTANPRCQIFGGQKSRTVSWPKETKWTYLQESGGTWMSDIPCEHQQMKDCLKGMRGHVLVGGLGLGLAATILEQKKTVKTITIVEKEQAVIDLVYPHLKDPSNKMVIVHNDLFEHLKLKKVEGKGPIYDYGFYDIWASDGEGTFFNTVCPLLDLSKGVVKREPNCWNISVMVGQLVLGLNNRFLFLNPEAAEKLQIPDSMRSPWEPGTDIWTSWYCPFFQWMKDKNPTEAQLRQASWFYCHNYGRWDWESKWKFYTEIVARTERQTARNHATDCD